LEQLEKERGRNESNPIEQKTNALEHIRKQYTNLVLENEALKEEYERSKQENSKSRKEIEGYKQTTEELI
jgi:hypothetical protein